MWMLDLFRLHREHQVLLLCSVAALGCATDQPNGDESTIAQFGALDRDLTIGDQGNDVRAVHAYLERYGYFPNEELQHMHPRWRPIVANAPAFADVFDQRSEEAVQALQEFSGLQPTGIVDAETRELMRAPRCGVPDGIAAADPSEKFAFNSLKLPSSSTWRLYNPSVSEDGIARAQLESMISAAMATWVTETNLTFTKTTSSTPKIRLNFVAIDGPGNTLARSFFANGDGNIEFDIAETWSSAATPPAGSIDVQVTALHELGHLLGLAHSTVGNPVMLATYQNGRATTRDDNVAVSANYDTWFNRPGSMSDITARASGTTQHVWGVTKTPTPGGFTIQKFNFGSSSWETASGSWGARSITSTRSGIPWIVDSNNAIFRRSNGSVSSGSWINVPGCALDISAGSGANDIWVIGCDGGVYQFNSSSGGFEFRNGVGARIAVDSGGRPWVVQGNGNIFRRSGSTWEAMPGCAVDIGAWHNVWVLGCGSIQGGFQTFVWNEQMKGSSGSPLAPLRREWVGVNAGAVVLDVGPFGPWLANDAGQVYQQNKPGTEG